MLLLNLNGISTKKPFLIQENRLFLPLTLCHANLCCSFHPLPFVQLNLFPLIQTSFPLFPHSLKISPLFFFSELTLLIINLSPITAFLSKPSLISMTRENPLLKGTHTNIPIITRLLQLNFTLVYIVILLVYLLLFNYQ